MANEKFPADAIYNWTYADEQRSESENPRLNLFTYQMSEIVRDELSQGIEINGKTRDYAFDLGEFFRISGGRFIHDEAIDKFLDALTSGEKFPYSTPELRNELKHTLWLLNRVEATKLLAKKLASHPVFKDYEVVVAAGNDEENVKAYKRVTEAIKNHDKTITLSVGQLTTGITIPEWSSVLMLANVQSPALYIQAAFRTQNPCLYHEGKEFYRKENAYVFDFDPARTLKIYEQFANNTGKADNDRVENVRELLNFFPVIGEDEDGKMIELDAEKVLSIPRKIIADEIVKSGFMSNFLFENISRVFNASPEVKAIIEKLTPVSSNEVIDFTNTPKFPLNDEGNISLPEEYVIGTAKDIFGEKVFGDVEEVYDVEEMKRRAQEEIIKPVIEKAKEHYGQEITRSTEKKLERELTNEVNSKLDKATGDYEIQIRTIEQERKNDLANTLFIGKTEQEINQEYDTQQEQAAKNYHEALHETMSDIENEAKNFTIETIETDKLEREKAEKEFIVKDHLRGFARTILWHMVMRIRRLKLSIKLFLMKFFGK